MKQCMDQGQSITERKRKRLSTLRLISPYILLIKRGEESDCERDQIQLEIIGNHLRMSVEDSAILEEKNDQSMSQRKEQSFQRMERLIPLPLPVSEKDIKTTFENGILKISIPKHRNRKFIEIDNQKNE
ncbi:Hsp20/alpha crystallin family protein [Alteribacillus sp. JSM 102045]|uniref:Hsp20/alpha crystallin family protein n=1 Tax=Alteribacillus sp. JSM 102045 TaxID=1562101 RepID=UPI0035C16705